MVAVAGGEVRRRAPATGGAGRQRGDCVRRRGPRAREGKSEGATVESKYDSRGPQFLNAPEGPMITDECVGRSRT